MANHVRAAKGQKVGRGKPPHRSKRSPEKKEELLRLIGEGNSISGACRAADVGKRTIYEWMEADPEFRAAVDAGYVEGTEYIADNLTTRAIRGDTTASIFILKSRDPAKYREKYKGLPGLYGGELEFDYEQEVSMVNVEPSINFADKKGKYLMLGGGGKS